MSYVVVGAPDTGRAKETLERYLYDGQKVIGDSVKTDRGIQYFIVDTGTNNEYRSQYITDRLNTGPFGARLFTSLPEAEAYVEDSK